MVTNFVFTKRAESNQPWYTFIMKEEDLTKTATIMKIEPFVLILDTNALTRESVWIRLYQEVNMRLESIEQAYALQVMDLLHIQDGPLLRNTRDRIIYPESLADILQNFPIRDASLFAMTALNRAKEHVEGTIQERLRFEKLVKKGVAKALREKEMLERANLPKRPRKQRPAQY